MRQIENKLLGICEPLKVPNRMKAKALRSAIHQGFFDGFVYEKDLNCWVRPENIIVVKK